MRKPTRRRSKAREVKHSLSEAEIVSFYMEIERIRTNSKPKRVFLPKPRILVYETDVI